MVRLLVEEARHALLQPNDAQRERDDRFLISTSTAGALPRSGSFYGPNAVILEWFRPATRLAKEALRSAKVTCTRVAERYGKTFDFGPRETRLNQRLRHILMPTIIINGLVDILISVSQSYLANLVTSL